MQYPPGSKWEAIRINNNKKIFRFQENTKKRRDFLKPIQILFAYVDVL